MDLGIKGRYEEESDIAKMVATAKEKLGGVYVLVNNAGQMHSGRFAAINCSVSCARSALSTR